jgi:hypothetical protein
VLPGRWVGDCVDDERVGAGHRGCGGRSRGGGCGAARSCRPVASARAAAVMSAERCSASWACACSAASRCSGQAAWRRILATVSRWPDTAAAACRPGARRLAGAVEPARCSPARAHARAAGPSRRLAREPLVLRRRTGETLDPRHHLVDRGCPEDHCDRIGLALDVERRRRRRSAAARRRASGGRSPCAASRRPLPGELARTRIEARLLCWPGASAASAAYSCRSACDSSCGAPALLGQDRPRLRSPTIGIDP